MPRVLKLMRILTAIVTCVMTVLLCWQCIDIYTDGVTAASSSGNVLADIYSMEDVLLRMEPFTVPVIGYIALIAGTVALQMTCPEEKDKHMSWYSGKVNVSSASTEMKHIWLTRTTIMFLALLFIVLGVMNGGLYDVLVKAINVCTECIGLG